MHLPERALRRRRLGGLGGELRLRVYVGQRQVPPHVADVGVLEQVAHDGLGPPAVGALEVTELDHRDRRVDRPAQVVALAGRPPGRGPGSASCRRGGPGPAGRGGAARRAGTPVHVSSAETTTADSAPSLASSSSSPVEGPGGDQQRHGEPDAGDGAAADHGRPPDGGPHAAAAERGDGPGGGDDGHRLADDVARRARRASPARRRRAGGSRRRARCRHWTARTAGRSHSWSTGGRTSAAGRSATASRSVRPWPTARARGSAARGTAGRGRWPPRAPRGSGCTPGQRARSPGRRRAGRPHWTSAPTRSGRRAAGTASAAASAAGPRPAGRRTAPPPGRSGQTAMSSL